MNNLKEQLGVLAVTKAHEDFSSISDRAIFIHGHRSLHPIIIELAEALDRLSVIRFPDQPVSGENFAAACLEDHMIIAREAKQKLQNILKGGV